MSGAPLVDVPSCTEDLFSFHFRAPTLGNVMTPMALTYSGNRTRVDVVGSPFLVHVIPNQLVSVTSTADFPEQIRAGTAFSFLVTARDAFGNLVQCQLRPWELARFSALLPASTNHTINCDSTNPDLFRVTILPHLAGWHNLSVLYNGRLLVLGLVLTVIAAGTHIDGSPRLLRTLPGPIDPTTTIAKWPRSSRWPDLVNSLNFTWFVLARDADNNTVGSEAPFVCLTVFFVCRSHVMRTSTNFPTGHYYCLH